MFVIVGIVVVILGVLGGFVLHGGPLGVLLQWSEFLIIGGAGLGSLLIGTPPRILKQILGNIGSILKGDPYTKQEYLNLLKTMYDLFQVARRDGVIVFETHIENPENSTIFSENSFLLKNHQALQYLCDTMKIWRISGIAPYDLEALLDADIETHHSGNSRQTNLVQKLADALPGLGIVAAVLGIVITMQAINGPAEEIGEKVAAALVGTFLGVLLCYGFVSPVASHLELLGQSESRYLECIKAGVVAFSKGNAPAIAVEFSRRVIYDESRPTFTELEQTVLNKGTAEKKE